jgi:Tfp pilus assembly major pilin PilA
MALEALESLQRDQQYRRGLLLGFTLSELMILLVFALLLAFGGYLVQKYAELVAAAEALETAQAQRDQALAQATEQGMLIAQINQEVKARGGTYDDFFDQLIKAKENESKLRQAQSDLSTLTIANAQLKDEAAAANARAAKAEALTSGVEAQIERLIRQADEGARDPSVKTRQEALTLTSDVVKSVLAARDRLQAQGRRDFREASEVARNAQDTEQKLKEALAELARSAPIVAAVKSLSDPPLSMRPADGVTTTEGIVRSFKNFAEKAPGGFRSPNAADVSKLAQELLNTSPSEARAELDNRQALDDLAIRQRQRQAAAQSSNSQPSSQPGSQPSSPSSQAARQLPNSSTPFSSSSSAASAREDNARTASRDREEAQKQLNEFLKELAKALPTAPPRPGQREPDLKALLQMAADYAKRNASSEEALLQAELRKLLEGAASPTSSVKTSPEAMRALIEFLKELQRVQASAGPGQSKADFNTLLRAVSERAKASPPILAEGGRGLGRGASYPPCWAIGTRAEYIFAVTIHESGLTVEDIAPQQWRHEMPKLQLERVRYGPSMALDEFLSATRPLFAVSQKENCRHYVQITDAAQSKDAFKKQLLGVERHFYKRIVNE